MKILVMTLKDRVKRYEDFGIDAKDWEFIWAGYENNVDNLIEMGGDADAILVDAISSVPSELINRMDNLKIIHSEGVGYEGIDLAAATKKGVYVCNNRAVNCKSVAEQAILLMLAVQRRFIEGDRMVKTGHQIEAKANWSMAGIPELYSKQVGLIGMGAIGKETAKRVKAFEAKVCYYNRTRLSIEEEAQLGIEYLELHELLQTSDIVSLHIASNAMTRNFMNKEKFDLMKKDAILINTARGEIVDNKALVEALISGKIGAAGLDTIEPEPVKPDNILLNVPDEIKYKLTFSPHIGGVTEQVFKTIYHTIGNNFLAVLQDRRPINIVNF